MWRGRGLQGPGERVNVKDIIQSLSRDLPFHKVIFSPGEKDTLGKTSPDESLCDWKEPSARTITILNEIFVKLFNNNKVDVDMIEKTLTLCPPDENISIVEDRDHYNLLHKAIIFNDTSLVTVLLNHGIDINTSATNEECMNLSKAKCPHANLGALHLASFLGCTDIVQILLRRGADRCLCRRVYTSAVVNAPLHKQPKQLNSNQLSKAIDIISKCGYREPVFYAVLGDHVEIVRILLGEQVMPPNKPDPKYRYLLHLACRVGAYQCLKYLLQLYPEEINSRDADGVPMLLMALNHDLKFVIVLLEHKADIHMLTDIWEPGSNVLHLLFQGLPLDGIQDTENISTVTEMCLQRAVNVNSQRLPFKRTPLHDLLSVMNIPVAYDPFWKPQHLNKDIYREQTRFDDELFKCVQLLLKYGAKVNLMDSNNRTPLQILLSNGNHTLRCNMCLDDRCPQSVKTAMATRSYGVDNTIDSCMLLLQAGCQLSISNPMRDFVEMMCSSYFGSDFWAWNHSLEILEIEPIFDSYMQLVKLQLQGGTNVNLCPRSQLPPLLYLLSHVADSPYADYYIVPMTTARRLSTLIRELLKYGARTEVQIEVADNGVRSLSCFDMLTPVLHTLQQYHQQRTGVDLEILKELSLPLLQFGAKSIVFHKVLYDLPEGARTPWKYCLPTHSFFYQLLQFGLLNLHLVNDGLWYRELFEIFYSQSDHYTVQDTLELIYDQMVDTHKNPCPCGLCDLFQNLIRQVFRTPRSLKQLCRLSIHHSLGIRIGERIPLLPLPSLLLNYLTSFKM